MNQFKRVQVIMLPTKEYKNSTLFLYPDNKLLNSSLGNQHLYIISDDEIKEGEENIWYYDGNFNKVTKWIGESNTYVSKWFNKIIATTDTSLKRAVPQEQLGEKFNDYYPLPQPSQQFIEKYIESYNKGEAITDVLVEYEEDYQTIDGVKLLQVFKEITKGKDTFTGYGLKGEQVVKNEPIINLKNNFKLKINPKDNTITIKKLKDSWNKEEVIELLHKLNIDTYKYLGYDNLRKIRLTKWIEKNL